MTFNLRRRKRVLSQESLCIMQEVSKRSRNEVQYDVREQRSAITPAWNATTSSGPTIHFLPPELLLNILQFEITRHRQDYLSPRDTLRTDLMPYSWVRLMRVCKYWRDLLQSSSELWSDVVLPKVIRNLDFMQETLRFSANAPLRIHAPNLGSPWSSSWYGAQVLKYVMVLSPRIRTLNLLYSEHLHACLKDTPSQVDYSCLTKLTLSELDDLEDWESTDPSSPFIASLREDPLPRLASLSMDVFPASICFSLFRPTLKELVLTYVSQDFSLFEFVVALRNMPLLEVLKFSSGRGTVSGLLGPSHFAAQLARLRTLQVTLVHADHMVYLLQRISMPPHTNRTLQIDLDSSPSRVPEILSHVLGSLPATIEDLTSPHGEGARASLFLSFEHQLCLSFKLNRSSHNHQAQSFPDISLLFHCDPDEAQQISKRLTERICSVFPLHKVDTLTLVFPPNNTDIENMFKYMPHVTTLRYRQTSPGSLAFPHALRVIRSNLPRPTGNLLLPMLSNIDLEVDGEDDNYPWRTSYLDMLHNGLADRISVGCGLQRLRLTLPDCWGQNIDYAMKDVAERVECCGREAAMAVIDRDYYNLHNLFKFHDEHC